MLTGNQSWKMMIFWRVGASEVDTTAPLLYPYCFLCLGNPCTLIASSFGFQWTWPPGCLSESLSLNWNGTGNAYRGRNCSIPSLCSFSPPQPLSFTTPTPHTFFFPLSTKENVTHTNQSNKHFAHFWHQKSDQLRRVKLQSAVKQSQFKTSGKCSSS